MQRTNFPLGINKSVYLFKIWWSPIKVLYIKRRILKVILDFTWSQCRAANAGDVISFLSFSENTSCSILDQLRIHLVIHSYFKSIINKNKSRELLNSQNSATSFLWPWPCLSPSILVSALFLSSQMSCVHPNPWRAAPALVPAVGFSSMPPMSPQGPRDQYKLLWSRDQSPPIPGHSSGLDVAMWTSHIHPNTHTLTHCEHGAVPQSLITASAL